MLRLASSLVILLDMKCWYGSKATSLFFRSCAGLLLSRRAYWMSRQMYSLLWRFAVGVQFHPIDDINHKWFVRDGREMRTVLVCAEWCSESASKMSVSLCSFPVYRLVWLSVPSVFFFARTYMNGNIPFCSSSMVNLMFPRVPLKRWKKS
jgi:hypothetical protein